MGQDEEVRITLRLPAKLRDELNQAGSENRRSLNAEIVRRLEDSFLALLSREELEAFLAEDLSDKEWAVPILAELRKPQSDVRRVVDFLDMMGVDAVSEVRRKRSSGVGP